MAWARRRPPVLVLEQQPEGRHMSRHWSCFTGAWRRVHETAELVDHESNQTPKRIHHKSDALTHPPGDIVSLLFDFR